MLGQVVEIDVLEMRRPDDVSGLHELLERRPVDEIVAIVGKTEGSGLVKDPARETADQAIKELLADRLAISVESVSERVCMVLSGGSPGIITPHIAVITRSLAEEDDAGRPDSGGRLVVGLAHSQAIEPHEVGRTGQINKVRDAVRLALSDAQLDDPSMVHAVLVKAPALTEHGIAEAVRAGNDTVTKDLGIGPEGAMCFSNDASALGVAVALGEVRADQVNDAVVRTDFSLYSDVAMTSSGGEKTHAEVLVLGNSPAGHGRLRIGHSSMQDLLDVAAVGRAMLVADPSGSATSDDVVYMMGKMIIPGSRTLRGRRITLHDDPVGYHVAKAMGGYLMAAATGNTCSFMSGGEQNSHQGPPDGNPMAAIVRVDQ